MERLAFQFWKKKENLEIKQKIRDFVFGNLGQESFDKNGPEKNEKKAKMLPG